MANEFIARKGLKALDSSTIEGTGTVLEVSDGTNVLMSVNDTTSGTIFEVVDSLAAPLFTVHDTNGITFNNAFTFPTADGSADQFLKTNGSGTLSWDTVTSTFAGLTDIVEPWGTSKEYSSLLYRDGAYVMAMGNMGFTAYFVSAVTKGDLIGFQAGWSAATYDTAAQGLILSDNNTRCFGIAVETIATGSVNVLTKGLFRNFDTSAWAEGDILYVSSSGTLTDTPPATGSIQRVGIVVASDASDGAIAINIDQDYDRFEDLDLQYVTDQGGVTDNSITAFSLTSQNDSATSSVTTGLTLYRNSATPANGDDLMKIAFTGNNSAASQLTYGEIFASIDEVTNPNEVGRLTFRTYNGTSFWDTGLEIHEGTISIGDTNPYTMPGADGTANYVLQTDGAGTVSWVDGSTLASTPTLAQVTAAGNSTTGNITVNGRTQGSSTSNVTLFEAITTDATGTEWPAINLWRLSSSPTVGDNVASVTFLGMNSGGSPFYYGKISTEIGNANSGVEDGEVVIYRGDGTLTGNIQEVARWTEDGLEMYESYTLPTTDGTSGQVLQTDGSGLVTWDSLAMEELSNVTVSSPVTNQVLIWNGVAGEWQNNAVPVPTLADVTAAGATTTTTTTFASLLQTGTLTNVAAGASAFYGTLRGATLAVGAATNVYTFPTADGNAGEVLMTDGAGAVTFEKARSMTFSNSGVHQLTTTTDTFYRFAAATTAPNSTYWTRTSTSVPTGITRTAEYSKAGHVIPVDITNAVVNCTVSSSISASASSGSAATEYNGDTISYYLYRWPDGGTAVEVATWTDTFNGGVSYAEEQSSATEFTLTASAGDSLFLVARCLQNATATRYWAMQYTIDIQY